MHARCDLVAMKAIDLADIRGSQSFILPVSSEMSWRWKVRFASIAVALVEDQLFKILN